MKKLLLSIFIILFIGCSSISEYMEFWNNSFFKKPFLNILIIENKNIGEKIKDQYIIK